MTTDATGLSERDQEMRRWNAPYAYREYPKMLYRAYGSGGRIDLEQRVVGSASEEADAVGLGWPPPPERARDPETMQQAAVGIAAAERAWDDRHLSPAAQAEAAAVDLATLRHLPEIPPQPQRAHRRNERR